MSKTFFGEWLEEIGMEPPEYSILSRLTKATLYRRRNGGKQGCKVSPEMELLMRALKENGSPRDRLWKAKRKMENGTQTESKSKETSEAKA